MNAKGFFFCLSLLPATLFAQKNDIGVFISRASYSAAGTSFTDPSSGRTGGVEFDSGGGNRVSYNRRWTQRISTEFGYSNLRSDMSIDIAAGAKESIGHTEFWMWSFIPQWHFGKFSGFSPYAGAGIAAIEGTVDVPGLISETETLFFNSETTWVATAGVLYEATPLSDCRSTQSMSRTRSSTSTTRRLTQKSTSTRWSFAAAFTFAGDDHLVVAEFARYFTVKVVRAMTVPLRFFRRTSTLCSPRATGGVLMVSS